MTVFLAVAVLVIEIIGQLTDHAAEIFSALLTGLNWLLGVAKPIIFGFVMAYILKPLNEFFTERYSRLRFLKKYSRVLGVVTTLLLVLIIITGIVSAIVYSVTNQLQVANLDQLFGAISAITKNVTDFYAQMMEKLQELDIQSEQIVNYVEGLSSSIMGFVQSLANGVIGSVSNISGYITTIMFGLVIGIYFMIDGNSMMSYFSGVADAVLPDRTNAKIRSVLADLNEVFSGYIRGQLLDVTFMIFATGTAMLITGISLAPIIGLMTGLANLVPYLGPFVGYSSIIIISVVEGNDCFSYCTPGDSDAGRQYYRGKAAGQEHSDSSSACRDLPDFRQCDRRAVGNAACGAGRRVFSEAVYGFCGAAEKCKDPGARDKRFCRPRER